MKSQWREEILTYAKGKLVYASCIGEMVHEWFMSVKIKHLPCCQGHRPQVSCVCAGWSCELKVSGAALACFTLKKNKK